MQLDIDATIIEAKSSFNRLFGHPAGFQGFDDKDLIAADRKACAKIARAATTPTKTSVARLPQLKIGRRHG